MWVDQRTGRPHHSTRSFLISSTWDSLDCTGMSTSPILAPVMAVIIWHQAVKLYRLFAAGLCAMPEETKIAFYQRLPWIVRPQPIDFLFVCMVLALMAWDADRPAGWHGPTQYFG